MAFYVKLQKEHEDDTNVIYRFGAQKEKLGRLRLNKTNGIVDELDPAQADNPTAFFTRATVKVRQHWRKRNFPEESCWAS
jgi:hypothetical protein